MGPLTGHSISDPTPSEDGSATTTPAEPLCARQQGFSLHAAVTVAASDKQGRLRLLRYGARPALSSQFLSLLPDGRVRYQLRRTSGPAGQYALLLQPTEFLHRLAATLPKPNVHRTVYHGIFSPAANRRFEVTAGAARSRAQNRHHHAAGMPTTARGSASQADSTVRTYTLEPRQQQTVAALDNTQHGPPDSARAQSEAEAQAMTRFCVPPLRPPSGRFPWAELIRRTFPDALDCPNCGGTLSVIAYITELAVARKILTHLGLPAENTELAPARLPDELSFDFGPDEHFSSEAQVSSPGHLLSGRGPPNGPLDL